MLVMSYTEFRKNLADATDKVNHDHAPVVITRKNGNNAVLISLDDFNAYQKTAYLMSSQNNIDKLNQSIIQLKNEKVVAKRIKKL